MSTTAEAAIEAARELLPAWCLWSPAVIWPVLAALVSLVCAALGVAVGLIPMRGSPSDAAWTERARVSYPVRSVARANTMLLPFLFAIAAGSSWGRIWTLPRGLVAILTAVAAFLPAWLVGVWLSRNIFGREFLGPRRIAGQMAFTYLIMLPHIILALLLVATLPERMDRTAELMICTGGAVMIWFVLGGGAMLVRRLGLLRPASPRTTTAVARVAQRAGVTPRGVYQLDCAMSNAFALWGSREIVFSDMLVEQMSDAELEAIASHELAHLSESRISKAARLSVCMLLLPLAATAPIIGSFGVEVYLAVLAPTLAAFIFLRRFARRMEEHADRQGHAHQADEGVYATALEKLYRTNLTPAVLPGNRHIHPHLYDRMLAAGVTPTYQRPAPPSTRWRQGALLASCLPLLVAVWVWGEVPQLVAAVGQSDARCATLAVRGNDRWAAWILWRLGVDRQAEGEIEPVIQCLQASTVLDEQSPAYPAELATMLARERRCPEAEKALAIALKRQQARDLPSIVRPEERIIRQALVAVENCGR